MCHPTALGAPRAASLDGSGRVPTASRPLSTSKYTLFSSADNPCTRISVLLSGTKDDLITGMKEERSRSLSLSPLALPLSLSLPHHGREVDVFQICNTGISPFAQHPILPGPPCCPAREQVYLFGPAILLRSCALQMPSNHSQSRPKGNPTEPPAAVPALPDGEDGDEVRMNRSRTYAHAASRLLPQKALQPPENK